MIMNTIREGDTLILPRNVHKSSLNSLVLTGGIPAYVKSGHSPELGIPLGMALDDVVRRWMSTPKPRRCWSTIPLLRYVRPAGIIRIAHERGMLVLADEAHGHHLYFGRTASRRHALRCGSCGRESTNRWFSHTEFHPLLPTSQVSTRTVSDDHQPDPDDQRSYLLMSSLDLARRTLALEGKNFRGRTGSCPLCAQ